MPEQNDKAMKEKVARAVQILRDAPEKSHLRMPVDDLSILVTNSMLAKTGYPPMPADYEALLREACGIMGPYLTLLGPGGMATAGGGLQPGLFDESTIYNRWNEDDEEKILVLGRMSGGVLITHRNGQYHITDESSRDVFQSYADVAELITDTVARLDKARRG